MLTARLIREVESAVNVGHQLVRQTHRQRSLSADGWERWHEACAQLHAQCHPTDYLWERSTLERIRSGDQEVIEDAILFLDVDPWFFRSGYLKEGLIRGLKRAPLAALQQRRLRHVVLKVCQGRNRREFRCYCSLGMKLWTPEFEDGVRAAVGAHDAESNHRFAHLLRYLEQGRLQYGERGRTNESMC